MFNYIKDRKSIHEFLFYISLGMYYIYFFVSRSLLYINGLKALLLVSTCLLAFATLISTFRYTKKEMLIQFILYLFISISVYNNKEMGILQLCTIILLVLNSVNVNFETLLKFSFLSILIMYLFITIAARFGFIGTKIFPHAGTEVIVNTYGFLYYNVPSLSIFTLLILYVIFKNKITVMDLSIYVILSYWSYKVYTQRLIFVLSLLYIVMYVIFKKINIKSNVIFTLLSYLLPIGMVSLSFILPYVYLINSNSLYKLNMLLNSRITLFLQAFDLYKVTIFGQPFIVATGDKVKYIGNYFFLDNAYAYALLAYGVIFFIGLIIEYTKVLIFLQKRNELKLYLWVVVIVIGGTISIDWILSILFSPCLYLFTKSIKK